MARLCVIFAVVCVTLVSGFDVPPPEMSRMSPNGLRMRMKHEPGMTLWGVHYSVNKPLPGVTAGDWNFDVTSPTGDFWVHENTQVTVNNGDTVNYWVLVIYNGSGYQLLEQSWVAKDEPDNTTPAPTDPSTLRTEPSTVRTEPTSTDRPTQGPTNPPDTDSTTDNGGGVRPTSPAPQECTSYPCLIFEDNFDTLDHDVWEHEITAGGGGNWEFQYYTNNRSNTYTRDGVLYMKPTLTADKYGEAFLSSGVLDLWGMAPPNTCTGNEYWGCQRVGNPTNIINPIQSARLRSVWSLNFRYGKVEVEAQLPKGDWIWPAIWLLPKNEAYGGWPASGEIDIMESRGNDNLRNEGGESMGNDHFGATLHWGPFWPYNGYEKTTVSRNDNYGDAMHKYGLEWDEDSIRFYIDGQHMRTMDPGSGGFWKYGEFDQALGDESNPWRYSKNKMAPFDQEFYLIMNVAVGGTNGFFPDSWTNTPYPKPWNNNSPTSFRDFWNAKNQWYPTWKPDENNGESAAMKINSIKVWKLKDN